MYKKNLILFILLLSQFVAFSQKNKQKNLEKRIFEIEQRAAIKTVVDSFSILADQKDVATQVFLFTEDAIVESYIDKKLQSTFKGRKQIGDAFSGFLGLFETVYHINGQQVIELKGTNASATSYCLVTLIGDEKGKKMKTTLGVYYNDDFVFQNNRWLISRRKSNFAWQEKVEMK